MANKFHARAAHSIATEKKIMGQRENQMENRRRGMKTTFKNTKGGVFKKVSAALDFEATTTGNKLRAKRQVERNRKAREKK